MGPPQGVKTWATPACLRTRATSGPPVRSAMASSAMEKRQHLGREALDLLALLGGGTDRIQDDVVAAGGAEALDRLRTLRGGADDPVLSREGLEVLRVTLCERLGPHGLGRLVVAAHGDEREVRGGEMGEVPAGGAGRGTDP